MTPLTKALDELKFRINRDALKIVFTNAQKRSFHQWRNAPIDLDEVIMNEVIRPRVLVDCDLFGGMIENISLEGVQTTYFDNYTSVYQLDAERLGGKTILSALSVGYMPLVGASMNSAPGYGAINPQSVNLTSMTAQRLADSFSGVPPISTAAVRLIGKNTIMITDQQRITSVYFLRCMLANEENLNNLHPRSYTAFAKLVELAVKSYMYNQSIISMDRAHVEGGMDLGSLKDYLESFSDAEEMYQTHLREVWSRVAIMQSQIQHDRFIKRQINPAL